MYTIQLSINGRKPGPIRYFLLELEIEEDLDYAGDEVVRATIVVCNKGFLARKIQEIEEKERILTGQEDPIVVIDRVDIHNCKKSITLYNALLFKNNEDEFCLESLKKETIQRNN